MTHDEIVARLEEAGRTILTLPPGGRAPRLRTGNWKLVEGYEEYAASPGRLRLPAPSAQEITRMDEAFGWLQLIPDNRYVMRRIVAARLLVSPWTQRHLFPWRRLGTLLGADHKAIQRWHRDGINLIALQIHHRAQQAA